MRWAVVHEDDAQKRVLARWRWQPARGSTSRCMLYVGGKTLDPSGVYVGARVVSKHAEMTQIHRSRADKLILVVVSPKRGKMAVHGDSTDVVAARSVARSYGSSTTRSLDLYLNYILILVLDFKNPVRGRVGRHKKCKQWRSDE
jgi:hypothetical protein